MVKGSGCSSCLHPTCPYGRDTLGVSQCTDCQAGVLVLDPASGPKWRLGCNRCDVIVQVFERASKVQVLTDVCTDCGSQKVSVEYKEGKSKLKEGALSDTGCIYCSPALTGLVAKQRATMDGGGRGRGRGRGRGAPRGRGRGRAGRR